jgi:outer membrane protein insertion porin family
LHLRGYENNSLTAENATEIGATIYNKYTLELRYPLTLNPSATVYGIAFAEAGNSWLRFDEFNPFDIYRSLGVGVRIFMPMFGLLGFDWGYGFDEVPGNPAANKGQFHISIGQQF